MQQAYLQYAFQAAQQKSALAMQSQQQAKIGMLGPTAGKDQDIRMGNLKMQELMSMQAANQAQASSSKNSSDHFSRSEKQVEQGQHLASDQRNEQKSPLQPTATGQLMPANVTRPMQAPQTIQNMANNHLAMTAQLQAIQAWALERNIDLSQPANVNLMAQLIPFMQARMAAQLKANESNPGAQSSHLLVSKPQVASPSIASESSPRANSSSDVSGQSGTAKARQTVPSGPFGSTSSGGMVNNPSNLAMQQQAFHSRENQAPPRQTAVLGNGMPANTGQGVDQILPSKNALNSSETSQARQFRQLNRSSPQSAGPSTEGGSGNRFSSQGGPAVQMAQQRTGFTKQQSHVLKAQILAFRRLKVWKSLFTRHFTFFF
jgi:SWI/SNF-related matrix-associated actin-dependent regulator of chromatin subfamily A protein 2/4